MPKRISEPSDTYDPLRQRQIISDITARFAALESAAGPYTITNFTPTRSLNMSVATATDIGNFVATLVSDLQAKGRLLKP